MIRDHKTRISISLDKKKLAKFKSMAKAEDLTLSQLISRKLSDVEDISEKFDKFLKDNKKV